MQTLEAQTVSEAHAIIERFSEEQATTVVRELPVMKIGQAARQGDVYFKRIDSVPEGFDLLTDSLQQDLQLVDGNTQGSRHVLTANDKIKIYIPKNKSELVGPVIVAESTCFLVTHPEHAHFKFQPGIFEVTFQRDWAEHERRVRD